MIEKIITLILGVVVGAFPTWIISYLYYKKASEEQRKIIEQLEDRLRRRNTLEDFEELLENSTWTKTHIDHKDVWVCDSDNTYQIEIGDEDGEFTEDWTTVFPDKTGYRYYVYLKIGNTRIKELTFISMDGHRYFVPLTETRTVDGKREFYWNIKSLSVKVCRIIGEYYRYHDLESVARFSKVSIEDIEER